MSQTHFKEEHKIHLTQMEENIHLIVLFLSKEVKESDTITPSSEDFNDFLNMLAFQSFGGP